MSQPLRFLNNSAAGAAVVERFAKTERRWGISYATVRDYCESRDELPQITGSDGDLKNVQRPWAVKAVLANLPPPARLLEIGGGEPIVSGFLAELGYEVTLVDPYDGFGFGTTDYDRYVELFPHVRIVRDYFRPGLSALTRGSFDVIFSISVLEHIPGDSLTACFDGIGDYLSPQGISIHCFDFILQGIGDAHDFANSQRILSEHARIMGSATPEPFEKLVEMLRSDVETFFLSPQGHHNWRNGQRYDAFPFRKVASLQMIAQREPRRTDG